MRVLSVVGARPQFVKLAPVTAALSKAGTEHVIVHTGQHYDVLMSDVFFDDLGIPTADVHLGIGSAPHGVQTGSMMIGLEPVIKEHQPDWVLVYGDTNSTLAAALTAVKQHVPVAHLEAGLRSHNRLMPEEINRVLTDHASDLCLAPTGLAMTNLTQEDLDARSVLVGDVMADVCLHTRDLVRELNRPVPGVDDSDTFILATLHRAENTDDPARLRTLLTALADLPQRVLLPVHPRLLAKADAQGVDLAAGSLVPVEPLNYPDMVAAVLRADAVVTDSGGLQKEAYLLETPCTTLRTETEWPETMVGGWNALCPDAADLQAQLSRSVQPQGAVFPYGRGDAASKVVATLEGRQLP